MAFKIFTKEWQDPDYALEEPADITRRSIINGFAIVKKELSLLSRLKHPHIIQLHGVIMRPLGLILELAPLGSLKNILHNYAEAHTHLHISVIKQVMIQVHMLNYIYRC